MFFYFLLLFSFNDAALVLFSSPSLIYMFIYKYALSVFCVCFKFPSVKSNWFLRGIGTVWIQVKVKGIGIGVGIGSFLSGELSFFLDDYSLFPSQGGAELSCLGCELLLVALIYF